MKPRNLKASHFWRSIGPRFLPFADAATRELPLARVLRLALFQITVGMSLVLLNGTLNRVMIVELGVPASLVAAMVALPLVFAPCRAMIGYRSDYHRSVLGWKRVPYIWFGTLLQFGGLAILPFALLVLGSADPDTVTYGRLGAALAFLLIGAGMHTTQTAGLALAADLAPERSRPRVVALLYVMLLVGMLVSAFAFSVLLRDFTHIRLIQVIQGAALVTMLINITALWKQETRNPERTRADRDRPSFRSTWATYCAAGRNRRFLIAVALGTAGISMQDILLEPYGAEVLGLAVGATTALTGILAAGTLAGFGLAARVLSRGFDKHRLAALGAVAGLFAFAAVIFAAPLHSIVIFCIGTTLIGFGGGLFSVGTLTAAMSDRSGVDSGMALGAWGAVQATAAGVGIAVGGGLRDLISDLAARGALGPGLAESFVAYSVVYHIEIALLFAALIAIGPLVGRSGAHTPSRDTRFGLAEFPT
jgi:BCD family chlorophyll transporter-like MFS transporter